MQLKQLCKTTLLAGAVSTAIGCGSIDLPLVLALEGENTITLDVPPLDPNGTPDASTSLVGGAEATISVNLSKIFSPSGILAVVTVDDVRIAGTPILFFGLINTGTICVAEVPDSGGGTALLKPLHGTATFDITLDTSVYPLALLPLLPDGFPFSATIHDTVPLTFADLIAFAFGGSGNISVSQSITDVLDAPDLLGGLLDGTVITANLTLASAEALPDDDPLLVECGLAGF